MKVVAIIQARMGSTRLPGKVLLDVGGKSLLERVVNRTQRAKTIDKVVVAMPVISKDDILVDMCACKGWSYFRGSEYDVLDRYYHAAKKYEADIVVRITSDCPLIDPEIIDLAINECLKGGRLTYASNTLSPRTFPRGLDVEAMSFEALKYAWSKDNNLAWREHVTPYIYYHPEKFNLKAITNNKDFSYMRWTVDTKKDLAFVRRVYSYFGHDHFSWHEVIALLEEHQDWLELNKDVMQKQV